MFGVTRLSGVGQGVCVFDTVSSLFVPLAVTCRVLSGGTKCVSPVSRCFRSVLFLVVPNRTLALKVT